MREPGATSKDPSDLDLIEPKRTRGWASTRPHLRFRLPANIRWAISVGSDRYSHIDALRAFAVLLVVIAHTDIGFIPGGSGVTMFFAISGFIITHVVVNQRAKGKSFSILDFYARRFLKLIPPLVAIVLVPTFLYSLYSSITWPAVLAQVFFVANWYQMQDGVSIDILPGSSVVWSLAIEEQFYIVFALIWLLLSRFQRWTLSLAIIGLIASFTSLSLRIYLAVSGQNEDRIYLGTDTRMEAIAIGVLAAMLLYSIESRPRTRISDTCEAFFRNPMVVLVALAAYLISLAIRDEFFRDTFRYSIQALATVAIILFGILANDGKIITGVKIVSSSLVIKIIGLASYSIYLAHDIVGRQIEPHLTFLPPILKAICVASAGILAGIAAWAAVEIPSQRLKLRLLDRRTAPEADIAKGKRGRA